MELLLQQNMLYPEVPECAYNSYLEEADTDADLLYYYLRSKSIEESLYSAPKSGLDRLLGCD